MPDFINMDAVILFCRIKQRRIQLFWNFSRLRNQDQCFKQYLVENLRGLRSGKKKIGAP